jgi:hypothetical protein
MGPGGWDQGQAKEPQATDRRQRLTVTDTQTGAIQTYTNPQGTPFQPIQDTNAFATCP